MTLPSSMVSIAGRKDASVVTGSAKVRTMSRTWQKDVKTVPAVSGKDTKAASASRKGTISRGQGTRNATGMGVSSWMATSATTRATSSTGTIS